MHSEVTMAMISDGTSNTYLLGEKYMDADHYLDGLDPGDDFTMYTGEQDDILRSVGYPDTNHPGQYVPLPPAQDTPGIADSLRFGSGHSGGCNMSFCDGSVRSISYSIDPEIHRRLGNRQDGQTIDGSKF